MFQLPTPSSKRQAVETQTQNAKPEGDARKLILSRISETHAASLSSFMAGHFQIQGVLTTSSASSNVDVR
jgi:hypothetical protein